MTLLSGGREVYTFPHPKDNDVVLLKLLKSYYVEVNAWFVTDAKQLGGPKIMPFWALNVKSLSCRVWLKINQSCRL